MALRCEKCGGTIADVGGHIGTCDKQPTPMVFITNDLPSLLENSDIFDEPSRLQTPPDPLGDMFKEMGHNVVDHTPKSPTVSEEIQKILDEYENGQNPIQSEEYRIKKATQAIEALIHRVTKECAKGNPSPSPEPILVQAYKEEVGFWKRKLEPLVSVKRWQELQEELTQLVQPPTHTSRDTKGDSNG